MLIVDIKNFFSSLLAEKSDKNIKLKTMPEEKKTDRR